MDEARVLGSIANRFTGDLRREQSQRVAQLASLTSLKHRTMPLEKHGAFKGPTRLRAEEFRRRVSSALAANLEELMSSQVGLSQPREGCASRSRLSAHSTRQHAMMSGINGEGRVSSEKKKRWFDGSQGCGRGGRPGCQTSASNQLLRLRPMLAWGARALTNEHEI